MQLLLDLRLQLVYLTSIDLITATDQYQFPLTQDHNHEYYLRDI